MNSASCTSAPAAEGEGDAVSRRHVRVGRVLVHLAGAAGRQHHARRLAAHDLAALLEQHVGADRAAVLDEDALGQRVLEHGDALTLDQRRERELDLEPRLVAACAQHAAGGVRALLAERDLALGVVEAHAVTHEVGDPRGRLLDEHARGGLVDETGAGFDRVLEVQLGGVARPDRRADAALRVARVRLVDRALRDDQHLGAALVRLQRDEQPGDAGADDQQVGVVRLGHTRPPLAEG